jgi:hypothetical protein
MENQSDQGDSSEWRVKLYELENTGNWIDLGVGHVAVQLVTELGGPALCIASEAEKGKYILVSKIQSEDLYEKQAETIILWKEYCQTRNIDYALSFQESAGCQDIWKTIIDVQGEYLQQREYGNIPSFGRTYRTGSIPGDIQQHSATHYPTVTDDSALTEDDLHIGDLPHATGPSVYRILPVDFSQPLQLLSQLHLRLESLHPSQRDYVFAQLLDEEGEYLRQLLSLFQQLESAVNPSNDVLSSSNIHSDHPNGNDLQSTAEAGSTRQSKIEQLRLLADVLRQIVLLNDPTLIEYLLSDEVFRDVAGVFEYDRALRCQGNYRQFLFHQARLVEVVPLQSDVRSTAKFLFRLKYLKEVMLHPAIDEPGITAVNSMIVFTSCEIALKLLEDDDFCESVLNRIAPTESRFLSTFNNNNNNSSSSNNNNNGSSSSSSSNNNVVGTDLKSHQMTIAEKEECEIAAATAAVASTTAEASAVALCGNTPTEPDPTPTIPCLNNSEPMDASPIRTDAFGSAIALLREVFFLATFLSLERRQDIFAAFLQRHSISFLAAMQRFFAGHLQLAYTEAISTKEDVEIEMRAARQCSEVLLVLANSDAPLLRQYLLLSDQQHQQKLKMEKESSNESLLALLVKAVTHGRDTVAIEQSTEVLRLCLDFERDSILQTSAAVAVESGFGFGSKLGAKNQLQQRSEREKFLQTFYERHMALLLSPFNEPSSAGAGAGNGRFMRVSRQCVLELLCLCVAQHSYRTKYFLLRGNFLSKIVSQSLLGAESSSSSASISPAAFGGSTASHIDVIGADCVAGIPGNGGAKKGSTDFGGANGVGGSTEGVRSSSNARAKAMGPDRHLQIYARRLLRQVLRLKDEFYLRHVARAELIPQILRSFQQRGEQRRDSLVTGALAETLLLLCLDPLPTILIPLWTRYGDTLLKDTLLGDSTTPALQELYDTLRNGAMQCLGMTDGNTPANATTIATAGSTVAVGSMEGVSSISSASATANVASGSKEVHKMLPGRARNENLRLREQSDEDEYFFGEDEDDDGADDQAQAKNHSDVLNKEEEEMLRGGMRASADFDLRVGGMKRSVEDLYSSDSDSDSDAACSPNRANHFLHGSNSNSSSSESSDSSSNARRLGGTFKLQRPSSPPHYSHVPSLSPNSLTHHLRNLHHSHHSVNSNNSGTNTSAYAQSDSTSTSTEQHNSNHNNTDSPSLDALQWLRHSYSSDSNRHTVDVPSPERDTVGIQGAGFGKFEADEDDEEDHFLAQLARKKNLPSATATSPSTGVSLAEVHTLLPVIPLQSVAAAETVTNTSVSSPNGKLSFSLLRRPSVGSVQSKFQ